MPKIREFIRAKREERERQDAIDNYDPRLHREQVADEVAKFLKLAGYDVLRQKRMVDGPLGGESDRIDIEINTPAGDRQFMLCVYARGVYAMAKDAP